MEDLLKYHQAHLRDHNDDGHEEDMAERWDEAQEGK